MLSFASPAGAIPPQPPGRNVFMLSHRDDFAIPAPGIGNAYSSCWGYVHSDGREYALLGTSRGTAIYSLVNALEPRLVAHILGPVSQYREMKQYRDWIYIVTEGTTAGRGVQVVRMTDPEHPVLVNTVATDFLRSHTVSVDTTRALLFCNGTWTATGQGAMRILSLASPENPVEIGRWPTGPFPIPDSSYVHDSVAKGNLLYASSIGSGWQRVLDLTDPTTPVEISRWTYEGARTHNAWPDTSGRWLYVTDEINGEPLKVFDVSDLDQPRLVNGVNPNPQAIVHNAYVNGDELFTANYTEGIRVLDISDPARPAEFGWSDTYAGESGGFAGVWNVFPFFPSGVVITSHMQKGLHVYWVLRDYGLLRVNIVDSAPSLHHDGEHPFVAYLTTQGDSLEAPADGVVQFAPSPGRHQVIVRRFGYFDGWASAQVDLGDRDTVRIVMSKRPVTRAIGTLVNTESGLPIADAEITLLGTPLHAHTDSTGAFEFESVPLGVYTLAMSAPGYRPLQLQRAFTAAPVVLSLGMAAATYWDPIELQTGWSLGAAGDDAVTGEWVWEAPKPSAFPRDRGAFLEHLEDGAAERPEPIEPEADRTPGRGTLCFLTGSGTSAIPPGQDVSGGLTTLTSPQLDLTGMVEPTIGCWVWFYSFDAGTGHASPEDWLAILVSGDGGATWTTADTLRGLRNSWTEFTIPVRDVVQPGLGTFLRFVAADRGSESLVEAAVDDLILYDSAAPVTGVGDVLPPRFTIAAVPQPSAGVVALELGAASVGPVQVTVFDAQGRRVRMLEARAAHAGPMRLTWDGRDDDGRAAPAGLYFARARAAGDEAWVKLIRLR
jgi:choice-of-anchor B domain-containing protein